MSNMIGSVGFNPASYPVAETRTEAMPKAERQPETASDSVSIGCDRAEAMPKKKWTVLLYSAADNNLETSLVKDVAELESVGSSDQMNLVVQLDRGKNPSSISGGWKGCKRFYLNQDNDKNKINSPALADLGNVNMSDPKVLSDFIQWGMKEYPAENYILIMSDHGAGWPGALQDVSHNDFASTPALREGIEDAEKKTGQKINIIGFDACLMASTEVAYELAEAGDYMVASQNVEGGDGWPYSKIFSGDTAKALKGALEQKFDVSPEEVAKKMVNDSYGFPSITTLAAMDLSKMKDLAAATDRMAEVIMQSPHDRGTLRSMAAKTKSWEGFRDQYDFADKIIANPKINNPELKEAAKAMQKALSEVIIAEQHEIDEEDGAHGLSLEISTGGVKQEGYADLKFAKDTRWDEAMKWLGKNKNK
ncbi:MAG: clostripain-related cysteine peptidase [bacterium]|nr:clostripain-related cysteine peptidase [bacterium]